MIVENADCILVNDFINPHFYIRSAGIYRLATEIRNLKYTVQTVECFSLLSEEQQFELLSRAIGPDTKFIGFNSTYFNYYQINNNYYNIEYFKQLISKIKKINPRIKTVIGGYHAMQYAQCFDVVITGLADNAIVEFIKFMDRKNPFLKYRVDLNLNCMIIDGDGYHAQFNFQSSSIQYSPEDNIIPGETLPIEIGRGCIFKCKFCAFALNGKKKNDYIKDVNVLREEFIKNYNEYGTTHYVYSDDTHNDNVEKLRNLADMIQSLPFQVRYGSFMRLDLMRSHPEQYQLLRDGGMIGAAMGIETLNHDSGKAIGKGLEPGKLVEEMYKFREKLPMVGVSANFIVGLPYETKESVTKWVEMVGDSQFPLDSVLLNPLYINFTKEHKSEFALDNSKYYTWENINGARMWHNGDFNRVWAGEFCSKYYKLLEHRQKISGFQSAVAPELSKKHISEFKKTNFKKSQTDQYIKKLFDK